MALSEYSEAAWSNQGSQFQLQLSSLFGVVLPAEVDPVYSPLSRLTATESF